MATPNENLPEHSELGFSHPADDTLCVVLSGSWAIGKELPESDEVEKQLQSNSKIRRVSFDAENLPDWGDTSLVSFMIKVKDVCARSDVAFDQESLPNEGGGISLLG